MFYGIRYQYNCKVFRFALHVRCVGHRRERARAVTTVFGALDVGSAVGLLICGPLIQAYGWPSVFYLFAVAGFLWCLAWPLFKPDQSVLATSAPPAHTPGDESLFEMAPQHTYAQKTHTHAHNGAGTQIDMHTHV